jgi:hypothetical protein
MAERVNFKLTKPWGMYKKGHVFENMKKSRRVRSRMFAKWVKWKNPKQTRQTLKQRAGPQNRRKWQI